MPVPGYPIIQSPLGTQSLYDVNHFQHLNRTVDVRGHYGALGDGTTDDTTAFQDAVDDAPSGGAVFIPPTATGYKLTDDITISKPLTVFGYSSLITQTGSNKNGFTVASSNVHFDGLSMYGPQYAVLRDETAFSIVAPSWAGRYTSVTVRNCSWTNWGIYGIYGVYLEDFDFSFNRGLNVSLAHIQGLSLKDGVIDSNRVKGFGPGSNGDWYGIAISSNRASDLTVEPLSTDIIVSNNRVWDSPWEGIDTHGGQNLKITGNKLRNCLTSITVTSNGPTLNNTWAPRNVEVIGNLCISDTTPPSAATAGYGIQFLGADTGVNAVNQYATGHIADNTIIGYGSDPINASVGGIVVKTTEGLGIEDNQVINCAGIGIGLYHDNIGYTVQGNTITDVYATTGDSVAINVADDYNTGYVGGNNCVRGSLDATGRTVNGYFLKLQLATVNFTATHNTTRLGPNRSDATTYLYDPQAQVVTGGLTADVGVSGNTLGTLVGKSELFDATGVSVGFVPVYNVIGYTPYAGVSGLSAWYDAETVPGTNGVAVSTWRDLTTNRYDMTAAGSLRPLYIASGINGHAVLRFDGTDDYLRSIAAGLLALFTGNDSSTTIFIVASFASGGTGSSQTFFSAASTSRYELYRTSSTGVVTASRKDDAAVTAFGTHTTAVADSTPCLITVRGNATAYDIGIATAVESFTINVGTSTPAQVNIGGSPVGSTYPSVDIGQVLIYGSALSDPNRTTVESALTTKWGL